MSCYKVCDDRSQVKLWPFKYNYLCELWDFLGDVVSSPGLLGCDAV